jgi:hypothetical protein
MRGQVTRTHAPDGASHPVEDGDLPGLHLGPTAQDLRDPVPQRPDPVHRGAHRLFGLPGGCDDAAAGVTVGEEGETDEAVHLLDCRHHFVAHVGGRVVDRL